MKTLFVTGATGFIGTHLLQRLVPQNFEKIYCLSRNSMADISDIQAFKNVEFIQGDIFDDRSYSRCLASSNMVVHLAAVTGKAEPNEYFRVNAKATEFLIRQCESHGVKDFLYVSSIAAKFTDISQYYYAQSKKEGEYTLKNSTLKYALVRPTMVLGYESPIWQSLSELNKGPFTIVFGNGKTNIQPIFVNDLADCISTIINEGNLANEEFDLGGPEDITFEDFLRRIYLKYHGKDSRVIHIPLQILIPVLTLLEKRFYSLLPINVGQLASFKNDGTIEPNRIFDLYRNQMKTVDEMIGTLVDHEKQELLVNELTNECRVFCHYLVNQKPNSYVLEKYLDAHKTGQVERGLEPALFDRLLINIAKINTNCTKLVDVYTRLVCQQSLFRRKLVLFLAILESCSPYYSSFETVDSSRRHIAFLKILQKSFIFALTSILSVLFLGPFHIMTTILTKIRGAA